MEASPLKLHKAFYNRKAKAASFCISGFVSAHKPFRQFLHIHGQLIPRDIFQDDLRLISLIIEIQVGPCPGQRIFANVGQEIFQAAVGLFPVQLQMDLLLWNRNPAVDLRFLQPLFALLTSKRSSMSCFRRRDFRSRISIYFFLSSSEMVSSFRRFT